VVTLAAPLNGTERNDLRYSEVPLKGKNKTLVSVAGVRELEFSSVQLSSCAAKKLLQLTTTPPGRVWCAPGSTTSSTLEERALPTTLVAEQW